eukprot:TRINITY_DN7502_c0_g3_i2.p1 TRINITY_DN7502_c0_g3~~TRINITY_DN7502_c0_g3_i2.p1  ORF type:complete len:582 (+),score=173.13 TRINITY_DN7502_c0_g3_i2:153-1748(+)
MLRSLVGSEMCIRDRVYRELVALLCARVHVIAIAGAFARGHSSPKVREMASGIANAQSEEALPSFEQIESLMGEEGNQPDPEAASAEIAAVSPEGAQNLMLPFEQESIAESGARLQSLRAELSEIQRLLSEKLMVLDELVDKLSDTGHPHLAQQISPLADQMNVSGTTVLSEFQKWSVLGYVASLTEAVSAALDKVRRASDAAVLAQAASHLQKGKEIDWALTAKQLGMLREHLIQEGSDEAAASVGTLQQVCAGVIMWFGDKGKCEREQLEASVAGCVELGRLLSERGYPELGAAVKSLGNVRTFARDKVRQARELATACLANDSTLMAGYQGFQHESPLKFKLLHDEEHKPVHSGLSSPFLESSAFLDRARHELRERINAHSPPPGERVLAIRQSDEAEKKVGNICEYTPRDIGPEKQAVNEWVPETPRTRFGEEVAGVISRLQMEGTSQMSMEQRNVRLKSRMIGLDNRMKEISVFMEDGRIDKVDSLNQGIDRVSQRLVDDIEERENMEADVRSNIWIRVRARVRVR